MHFIDEAKLQVFSGKGGDGCCSFRRERYVPFGGPDGGDGGRGGSIIFVGTDQKTTLSHLRGHSIWKAKAGQQGGANKCTGKSADDVIIPVPLGTRIYDATTDEQLIDITEIDQIWIACTGGRGGLGNVHFKSPTNQTPRYAQPGIPSKEGWFILELKVLADVGLVGFPNAGKSTLLSVVSAAKPEIANYPFTTLVPNLGIVSYRDHKSFIMADIPGIIEGAAEGRGLGLRFLRHIERNSTLLFMVPADSDNIKKEYEILLGELEKYNPELLDKDRMLAISKSDMLDEELKEEIKAELPENIDCLFISSVAQQGLTELKDALWYNMNK